MIHRDRLWTWFLPDTPREPDMAQWRRHGGKWIVFHRKAHVEALARALLPLIEDGEIACAKIWNGDPSALCVYCLDSRREEVRRHLARLGATRRLVWEYDHAWDRNLRRPAAFVYSWFSKFRTILQSYGLRGAFRLLREVLKEGKP